MKPLSSIDLFYLMQDLKILEEERVDNFYYENETFYMRVYKKGGGRIFLTTILGTCIYIGTEKEESSYPDSFIMHLRKFLTGGFIKKIEQIESERIIKIKIDKKNNQTQEIESFFLFIDMFSPGNVILTDSNLNIKHALQRKKFKDRKILVGESYELPPSKQITFENLHSFEKFSEIFSESERIVVKELAISLGMGGKYSEEIIARTSIEKNKPSRELSKEEIEKIYQEILSLKNKEIDAFNSIDNNKVYTNFFPYKFESSKEDLIHVKSFNEAIKNYYLQFKKEEDKKEKELNKQLDKLKNRLEKQKKQKDEIFKEYEKLNSIGEKIYQNYSLVDDLLKNIEKASKEKGWEYVKEKIKNDERLSKVIKKIDEKNNKIILDLD